MFASEDALRSKPPHSNTGAIGTNGLNTLIDWVSFTLKEPLESVFAMLKVPVNEFVEMKRGLNGYLGHVKRGAISVLYNGQCDNMGVHVMMTGMGRSEE